MMMTTGPQLASQEDTLSDLTCCNRRETIITNFQLLCREQLLVKVNALPANTPFLLQGLGIQQQEVHRLQWCPPSAGCEPSQ
eukprot:5740642-Amphidinium_carterae.1